MEWGLSSYTLFNGLYIGAAAGYVQSSRETP